MVEIGKKYKTKNGSSIRTPINFDESKKMVYCKVKCSTKIFFKWYYINARQFENEIT